MPRTLKICSCLLLNFCLVNPELSEKSNVANVIEEIAGCASRSEIRDGSIGKKIVICSTYIFLPTRKLFSFFFVSNFSTLFYKNIELTILVFVFISFSSFSDKIEF